jgi:hypothetical protein
MSAATINASIDSRVSMMYSGLTPQERRDYLKSQTCTDASTSSLAVLYERLGAMYSNFYTGVSTGFNCNANAALAMWPDPAGGGANGNMVTSVRKRKNGRVTIELNAMFYPYDDVIPTEVLNLLYCLCQPRCTIAGNARADICSPHTTTIYVYIYGADDRRPAATPAIVAGNFNAAPGDLQLTADNLMLWLMAHDENAKAAQDEAIMSNAMNLALVDGLATLGGGSLADRFHECLYADEQTGVAPAFPQANWTPIRIMEIVLRCFHAVFRAVKTGNQITDERIGILIQEQNGAAAPPAGPFTTHALWTQQHATNATVNWSMTGNPGTVVNLAPNPAGAGAGAANRFAGYTDNPGLQICANLVASENFDATAYLHSATMHELMLLWTAIHNALAGGFAPTQHWAFDLGGGHGIGNLPPAGVMNNRLNADDFTQQVNVTRMYGNGAQKCATGTYYVRQILNDNEVGTGAAVPSQRFTNLEPLLFRKRLLAIGLSVAVLADGTTSGLQVSCASKSISTRNFNTGKDICDSYLKSLDDGGARAIHEGKNFMAGLASLFNRVILPESSTTKQFLLRRRFTVQYSRSLRQERMNIGVSPRISAFWIGKSLTEGYLPKWIQVFANDPCLQTVEWWNIEGKKYFDVSLPQHIDYLDWTLGLRANEILAWKYSLTGSYQGSSFTHSWPIPVSYPGCDQFLPMTMNCTQFGTNYLYSFTTPAPISYRAMGHGGGIATRRYDAGVYDNGVMNWDNLNAAALFHNAAPMLWEPNVDLKHYVRQNNFNTTPPNMGANKVVPTIPIAALNNLDFNLNFMPAAPDAKLPIAQMRAAGKVIKCSNYGISGQNHIDIADVHIESPHALPTQPIAAFPGSTVFAAVLNALTTDNAIDVDLNQANADQELAPDVSQGQSQQKAIDSLAAQLNDMASKMALLTAALANIQQPAHNSADATASVTETDKNESKHEGS